MKKIPFLQFLPLIILSLSAIYSLFSFFLSDIVLSYNFYFGVLAVIICWVFFKKVRAFKVLLGTTLLLGSFEVFTFTPTIYKYGLFLGSVGAEIEPLSFLLFVFFIVLNFDIISKTVNPHLNSEKQEKSEEEKSKIIQKETDYWKNKYNKKTDFQLQQLARNSESLLPEAQNAIQELLVERGIG